MTRRRGLVAVLALLIGVGGFALKTLYDAGEFKVLRPVEPGPCQTVTGVESSEDITIDALSGVAFISADDRRGGGQGAIYAYDLSSDSPVPRNLTGGLAIEFHPHGISFYRDPGGGEASLFVVNHRREGDFVEIFDWRDGRLTLRDSIADPLIRRPNDVAATGPKSFYVSIDHGSRSRWGMAAEEYLQLARAYVAYYDGASARIVAAGFAFANGVNISPDGSRVYVAASVGRTISVFDRNRADGTLKLRYVIDAGTGVDNIEVDRDGNLWVGAHPRLFTFSRYAKDPSRIAPSQVFKVTFFTGNHFEMEDIYVNAGDQLSASSVAAVYGDRLLIGSVFDPRFLVCSINRQAEAR